MPVPIPRWRTVIPSGTSSKMAKLNLYTSKRASPLEHGHASALRFFQVKVLRFINVWNYLSFFVKFCISVLKPGSGNQQATEFVPHASLFLFLSFWQFEFFWQFELVRVLLVHVTWSAIPLTVFTLKITRRMGNRGCKTRGSDISDCQYSLLNQVDLLTATSGPGFILG